MRSILFRAALLAVLLLAFGAAGARADTPNNTAAEKRLEFEHRPEKCPLCGSAKVAPILYGLPNFTDELERALDEGKVALGGCVITGDDPRWKCLDCEATFYEKNKAINNQSTAVPNL